MRNRRWTILLTVMIWSSSSWAAAEGTAPSDSLVGQDEDSWLSRNLERYFGDDHQEAVDLEGEALEIVDAYQQYAGLPIEVVLVHQVPSFKEGWDSGKSFSQQLINDMAGSFQSYTQDSVIRDYLLFQQGEKLDPHALADSEVMLRNLPYINGVRIVIIPLKGEIESVAIVVETTDRWPFGIKGKVVTAEKYWVSLYSENVAGTGIKFSNEFLHKTSANPSWGYRGILHKNNIKGSFLEAELTYEDSYRMHSQTVRVDRRLSHPGLHFVGGISLEHTDDFQKEGTFNKFNYFDFWVGDVKRLYDVRELGNKARPIMVPALRLSRWDYLRRPTVTPDSNRSYQDRDIILAGLSFQRIKYYKTSYLFEDGEAEDLPVGLAAKISAGYELREFQQRTPVFLEMGMVSMRHSGDAVFLNSALGGYYRHNKLEEGLFDVGAGYVTILHGSESYRYRFYGSLFYTRGIGRYPGSQLYLSDRNGIRDLSATAVFGNQRLTGSLESRLFTNWALLGFRFSFLVFTDAGMVGAEKSSSIFKEKIYVSTGIALRLRNPSLVLPTVQMKLSLISNVDDPGLAFGISVGNAPGRTIGLPGTKPGIPSYN